MQGDVLWIDELERLSTEAKDSDTTYFGPTTFSLDSRSKNASINSKFYTTVQDLIPEIQVAYRDEKHTVRGGSLSASQDKKYPVSSDMSITVALKEVKDPRKVERKPIPVAAEEPESTISDESATSASNEPGQPSDASAQENAGPGSAPNQTLSSDPEAGTKPNSVSEPSASTEPTGVPEVAPSTPAAGSGPAVNTDPVPVPPQSTEPPQSTVPPQSTEPQVPTTPVVGGQS
jgi:hypothetical protein